MMFDLLAPPAIQTQVFSALREVIGIPAPELELATPLHSIEGWDPMTRAALISEIECRLGLTLERAELEAMQTVSDLVHTFAAKRILATGWCSDPSSRVGMPRTGGPVPGGKSADGPIGASEAGH
jgi:acyl carrier protein